jgi:hypothetical protein
MSSQRRVTAPPAKAEVVTVSLRPESPGTPAGTETDPGFYRAGQAPSNKVISLDSASWTTRLCPGFLADLILPGVPGVGVPPL